MLGRSLMLWSCAVSLFLAGRLEGGEPELAGARLPLPAAGYRNHEQLLEYRAGGRLVPVRTLEEWQIRRRHILAATQEVMGPLPDRAKFPPLDVQIREKFSGEGYQRLTIDFAGDESSRERVSCYLYLPEPVPAGQKLPAVIALQPTGTAGKAICDGRGHFPNRGYGKELAQRGYVVIAPDYPGFGDSKYDFLTSGYMSGTMKAIVNHMRAIDVLAARPEVDRQRVAAIGHSLGGHNAIFLGVFDERVQVVVTSCGWTPFPDYYGYAGGKLSGWAQDRYMPRIKYAYASEPAQVPFDFPELIGTLAPRAFFSASPVEDHNFKVAGVRRSVPAAQAVYRLLQHPERMQVIYPACKHDFPPEARRAAYAFIDQQLQHTPSRAIP